MGSRGVERAAELVVCHAGAGIIAAALAAGRRPLVLPRRADLGEHIDEHQQQLARKLADWGLVVLLEDRIEKRDVARAQRPLELPAEVEAAPSAAQLVASELGLSPV